MALMAAISVGVGYLTAGPAVLTEMGTYVAAVTVVSQYFLGFRVRDRTTAFVASALLASSPLFSGAAAGDIRDGLFVLFTIAALAAFAGGFELVAVVIASGATVMRPEGILLGAVLLGFTLTERRPGGVVGSIVYLLCTFLGLAALVFIGRQPIPIPTVSLRLAPLASVFDVQTGIVALFIWAMLDDLGDAARRARWKPVIVWSVLFLCVESLFHFSGFSFESGPFRPVLLLLAAGGISRLLPVIAGNFANPITRYAVAVLFVGTLIFARVRAEWPLIHARTAVVATSKATDRATHKLHGVAAGLTQVGGAAHVPAGIPHHIVVVPSSAVRQAVETHAAHVKLLAASALAASAAKRRVKSASASHLPTNSVSAVCRQGGATTVASAGASAKPGALPTVPGLPEPLVARAVAAGVPLYTTRWGHSVARTIWAINWDLKHRPVRVVAKTATHPTPPVKAAATVHAVPAVNASHSGLPPPLKQVALTHPAPAAPAHALVVKPTPKPTVPTHAVVVAKAVAAHPAPAHAAVAAKPIAKHPVAVRVAAVSSLDAQAAAAGVPTYVMRHGRMVRRRDWAIRWDIAHKPHRVGLPKTPVEARKDLPVHSSPLTAPRGPAPPTAKPAVLVHRSVRPAVPVKRVAGRPVPAKRITAKPVAVRPVVLSALDTQAASAGVATYVVRHGRRVRRTDWAIRWDITHRPHPAYATRPIVHVVPAPHAMTPAKSARPVTTYKPVTPTAHKRLARVAKLRHGVHRRIVRKVRHRSIWAIRWARAHPKKR
jgi:hypothetical protein